jgi:hypothetical protein
VQPDLFFHPNFAGASLTFKCQFEGDTWIQSGTMPAKKYGVADYDYELYEVWKRIE